MERKRRGVVAGVAAGAALAYFLDPERGRTRRIQAKDQLAGAVRRRRKRLGRRADQKTTYVQDRARGMTREATRSEQELIPEDDRTLVDKVRSEVLGQAEYQPYTINVDAVEGTVALRGRLDRPDQIRELEEAVSAVPGVRSVENFTHLPGTPPPNK